MVEVVKLSFLYLVVLLMLVFLQEFGILLLLEVIAIDVWVRVRVVVEEVPDLRHQSQSGGRSSSSYLLQVF